jgi:1-aminocyclopropane-1-carboxylate deaminase
LITDYHFGGYEVNEDLIAFINQFYITQIPLDPIYTGKNGLRVFRFIANNNYFPSHSKILLIHTGGLQGIQGMNEN